MKQIEIDKRNWIMILCFIYAGISLILLIISLIIIVKKGNIIAFDSFIDGEIAIIVPQIVYSIAWVLGLFSLFGLVISVFAGRELQKTSVVNVKSPVENKANPVEDIKTIDIDMLMPDEVKVVKILEENDKSMTQNDLVKDSEMSKVKIHRIIKRLESKKIISKHDYGMTNRIKLEKSLRSENDE